MLRIEITAVHPVHAEGLSVAEQVEMALSGVGFSRGALLSSTARIDTSGESISAIDEAEPETGVLARETYPAGTTEADVMAGRVKPLTHMIVEQPKRRGRPKANAAETPAAGTAAPAEAPKPAEEPAATQELAPEIRANPEDRKEPEVKLLSHEDLRAALGRLSVKLGLATAVAEVRALVGGGIQDVPDTQEALGAVLAKMEARIAGGEPMAAPAAPQPTLTHLDVKNAIVAYAQKFGQEAAKADWPLLIGVTGKVDDMPSDQDTLSKAVKAITEGVEANPFGRTPAND